MTTAETTSAPVRAAPVVSMMLVVQALATMACVGPATIAPELARVLGVAPAMIGYQVSLTYFASATMAMLGTGSVQRFGAGRWCQISLLLCAAGLAIFSIPGLATAALGSCIAGAGYSLTNAASSHMLAKVAGTGRRNLLFSIKQTGVPLGVLAAGLTVPPVTVALGWQTAFLLVAALCLAWAGALQFYRRQWDADRDPSYRLVRNAFAGFGTILASPPLRNLSLAAFCYAGVQLCLMAYLVTLLVEELNYGLVQAGIVLSVAQVAGAMGRIFWGWLADRLRRGLLLLAGLGTLMVLGSGTVSMMSPAWSQLAVQSFLFVFAAVAIGWNGVYLAEVARLSPPGRIGGVTGGSLVLTYAGIVCIPSLFALVYRAAGSYTLTFLLVAAVAAAGALLTLAAWRRAPVER